MDRRIPLIIDTDPGIDDAVALMLAAASPEIDLLGITTVAGNVGIDNTTRNAVALKNLLGLSCPVGRGAWRTLSPQLAVTAAHVHGSDGLGGWQLAQPEPAEVAAAEPAGQLLSRLLRQSYAAGQKAKIVAIGPLTNIAQLLVADSQAAQLIDELVLMGGGFGARSGNITEYAEFNIYTDPQAAAIVFGSGVPVRMVGLNVTEVATLGPAYLPGLFVPAGEAVQAGGGAQTGEVAHAGEAVPGFAPVQNCEIARGLAVMLGAYKDTPEEPGLTAQHDSLALAAVVAPELVQFQQAFVRVETVNTAANFGQTQVEFVGGSAPKASASQTPGAQAAPNALVATAVDVPAFRSFMAERLRSLAVKLAAAD